MKRNGKRFVLRALFLLAALMLLTLAALAEGEAPAASAAAQSSAKEEERWVELSTEYPAMVVKAGDSLTFSLELENQSGRSQDLELSIEAIPEGWTGSFSASSKQVSLVHVKDEATNKSVSFALDIPLEAEDGDYIVTLRAASADFEDTMDLHLSVNAEEIGESSFSVEYPSQEGSADTSFSFDATLINNTLSEQSYSFSASAPSGWQVSFKPSGESTKVAALEVEARKSQGLSISVTPPDNIEAGTYEISCTATSASEKMETTISVTITGSYKVELSTPSGRLSFDAYANKESAVQLTVTNEGNSDLTNLNLTSSAPSGWNVRFADETIELLEPGATKETTMYVTPSEEAMSGDYAATITVKNSNASDKVEFRVTVKTETKWGIAGIAIIVLLAAALGAIMRRYGRR